MQNMSCGLGDLVKHASYIRLLRPCLSLSTLAVNVQQDKITKHLSTKADKADQAKADTLLTQALVRKNIAMAFIEDPYFKAYVAFISKGRHKAPTCYGFIIRLEELYSRIHDKVCGVLNNRAFIAFEIDSLTRAGRHFSALSTGAPGLAALAAVYDNADSDNAVNTADAAHRYDVVSCCANRFKSNPRGRLSRHYDRKRCLLCLEM